MALKEYITLSQIRYKPIKNAIALIQEAGGDLTELEEYLDITNNYYEDLAQQVHIYDPEELQFPIPTLAVEHLQYYFCWKYASESDNQVPSEFLGESTYEKVEKGAYKYYADTLKDMTKPYMTGDVGENNRRGVSFGRVVRG